MESFELLVAFDSEMAEEFGLGPLDGLSSLVLPGEFGQGLLPFFLKEYSAYTRGGRCQYGERARGCRRGCTCHGSSARPRFLRAKSKIVFASRAACLSV